MHGVARMCVYISVFLHLHLSNVNAHVMDIIHLVFRVLYYFVYCACILLHCSFHSEAIAISV